MAIYAHGGLVGEQGAGESAREWVKLFTDAQVFPIYLIWESDLLSVLNDRVQNELKKRGEIPTGGLVTMLDDAWSDRVEPPWTATSSRRLPTTSVRPTGGWRAATRSPW